jgi:thioredoxin reductase (NADPH)
MEIKKKDLDQYSNKIYDAIIIGGGAGGLSAGIYLQRFCLSSLIIDKGKARSFWMQELHNYLGLPSDTPGRNLLKQGKQQYEEVNGHLLNGYVEEITEEDEHFLVKVKVGRQNTIETTFKAKYIVAASGIIDHLPPLEDMKNVFDYAGYNLHVCMVCDGYEMVGKKCGFIAGSEASIREMIWNLSWFTPHITIFTHGLFEMSPELKEILAENNFSVVETPIKQFLGHDHQMSGIELIDGTIIKVETGLISMGSKYHNTYLENFDLERKGGNLITDKMCRTSHPRIFAIGDLKVGLNQVVIAAGDGALSATQIWRDLCRKSHHKQPL